MGGRVGGGGGVRVDVNAMLGVGGDVLNTIIAITKYE